MAQKQNSSSSSEGMPTRNPIMIVRGWCQERPLTAGVGLWATGMVGTGVYLYNRKMRTSLKVIQARILAQAGILLGITLAGVISYIADDGSASKPASTSMQLRQVRAPGDRFAQDKVKHRQEQQQTQQQVEENQSGAEAEHVSRA
eukprot:gb/GECG01015252.1/.p1 GENE.gb/GECG01015252.1/~~gb/GECG01015252.1/.p1  ORF type:complete len:145 (+),score=16.33 gb/GECG01015252.1/:1-435(+)